MNILTTGANGYIGSKIAQALFVEENKITGIDLYSENVPSLANNTNFKFLKADITNTETLQDEVREADILVHCAALVHKKSTDLSRENYFRVNFEGTKNIINFLDKGRLKQIIFFSTVLVYGDISCGIVPDENTRAHPEDFYGESKLAAENAIMEFSERYRIPYTIFRLAPVYGDFFLLNIHKRIYLPIKAAFYRIGSGEQRVSLCSVNNVIDVVSESINNSHFYNQTFIVKDIDDYTINQLIYFFKELYSQKRRPVIAIPIAVPMAVFQFLNILMPKKLSYLKYQFKKIAQNSIYSSEKLLSTGFSPKWNLYNTFQFS